MDILYSSEQFSFATKPSVRFFFLLLKQRKIPNWTKLPILCFSYALKAKPCINRFGFAIIQTGFRSEDAGEKRRNTLKKINKTQYRVWVCCFCFF